MAPIRATENNANGIVRKIAGGEEGSCAFPDGLRDRGQKNGLPTTSRAQTFSCFALCDLGRMQITQFIQNLMRQHAIPLGESAGDGAAVVVEVDAVPSG